MINNDHKYSVPVSFWVHDYDNGHAVHGSSSVARWYRHLIAPQIPTGLWIRQVFEQSEDYLIHILNRNKMLLGESCDCCLILCGGGYDILLLQNDTPYPEYIDDIPKIAISLSLTSTLLVGTNSKSNLLDDYGTIDPIDDLYKHMNVAVRMGVFPGNFRIYIHANGNCPVYQDHHIAQKVILRIENHAHSTVNIVNVDHKDAPKNIFSYQYDIWGNPTMQPNNSLGKSLKSVKLPKEPRKALSKPATQQSSRKRANTDASESFENDKDGKTNKRIRSMVRPITASGDQKVDNASTSNESKHEETKVVQTAGKVTASNKRVLATDISQSSGKKSANITAKSVASTALEKSNSKSATVSDSGDQKKPSGKRKDVKVTRILNAGSKNVNDGKTTIDATTHDSSEQIERTLASSQNASANDSSKDDHNHSVGKTDRGKNSATTANSGKGQLKKLNQGLAAAVSVATKDVSTATDTTTKESSTNIESTIASSQNSSAKKVSNKDGHENTDDQEVKKKIAPKSKKGQQKVFDQGPATNQGLEAAVSLATKDVATAIDGTTKESSTDIERKIVSSQNSSAKNDHEKNDDREEKKKTAPKSKKGQQKVLDQGPATAVADVAKITAIDAATKGSSSSIENKLASSHSSGAKQGSSKDDHKSSKGKTDKEVKTITAPKSKKGQVKVPATAARASTKDDSTHEEINVDGKTPAPKENLPAKQGSQIANKKTVKRSTKDTINTTISKTPTGSSLMTVADEQTKTNEKRNDAKGAAQVNAISEKINDSNAIIDTTTTTELSSSVGTKTVSSEQNKTKVTNKGKGAAGIDSSQTTIEKSNVDSTTTKKKECFYYPFCQMTVDICGGTQRGRCREVKSGRVNVAPNIDRKILSQMKREAKQKQIIK